MLYSDDDDGGSGGGRRHASASVSKTSFSADTPASQKRAIQSLKQSLTFSDNSVSGSRIKHQLTLCRERKKKTDEIEKGTTWV